MVTVTEAAKFRKQVEEVIEFSICVKTTINDKLPYLTEFQKNMLIHSIRQYIEYVERSIVDHIVNNKEE